MIFATIGGTIFALIFLKVKMEREKWQIYFMARRVLMRVGLE